MLLDRLQSEILAVLAKYRSEDSVIAGGSVLHRHAFRLSDDSDIFHSDDAALSVIANADASALREAGLEVDLDLKHDGLYEAIIYSEGQHPAKPGFRHEWLKRPFSLLVSIRSNPWIDKHQLREHKVNMRGFHPA